MLIQFFFRAQKYRMIRFIIFMIASLAEGNHRATYYQTFDHLVRNSVSHDNDRSKTKEADNEHKYTRSLQNSLGSQSLSSSSLNHPPKKKYTLATLNGDKKSGSSMGSNRQTYGSIGATTRSLETGGTLSSTSSRDSAANRQAVIVQNGGSGGLSKILNSEAAKSAAAAFGSAAAVLVAKEIESRFTKESDSPPAYIGYAPAGYAPYGGYR